MIPIGGMAKNYLFNIVTNSWPHSPCLLIPMEESLIYRGIEATSIKYTKEHIENLANREINFREKDISEENGYLSDIQGMLVTQDEETKPIATRKECTCTQTQNYQIEK